MNILLIYPQIRADQPAYNFPIGLGYIAAVLLQEGHHVEVIDMNGRRYSEEGFEKELRNVLDKTNLIGIGGLITTYKAQSSLVKTIREMGYKGKIVLGGGLATSEYEILFENLDIDICVQGEGERVIKDLADHLENEQDLKDVRGIIYRKNGEIVINPPAEPNFDLDTIPFPAWDLFPVESYLRTYYHGSLSKSWPNVNEMVMITSRGCPYRCNFCYHIFGYKYRYRTVGNIIKEIQLLRDKYGERLHVRFLDDCFVVNKKRLTEFCNRLIDEKMNITWSCLGRANICTREILMLMKRSGCLYVGYGLESGNDEILKKVIGKSASVKENINAVKETLRAGLMTSPTIMTNQPGENADTIKDTVDMVREIGVSNTVLFYACPYPGTPLWDYAVEHGLIKISRKEFLEKVCGQDVNQLIVNLTDLPDEDLIRLHDEAESEIKKINKRKSILKLIRFIKFKGIKWTFLQIYNKVFDSRKQIVPAN